MENVERLSTYTDEQYRHLKSLDYVRWISCLIANSDRPYGAADAFTQRWPRSIHGDLVQKHAHELMTKTASEAGTTTATSWASPLSALKPLVDGFLDLNRPNNLLGKLDPFAQHVPFETSVPVRTSGGTYRWVPQGTGPKPTGSNAFTSVTMSVAKMAGILVVSKELAKLERPGSDVAMREGMSRDLSDSLDQQLTDPAVAAVAGSNPGSITNLAPTVGSSGTSQANAATDFRALSTAFWAANPRARALAILTSPSNAVALATALTSDTCGPFGGTLNNIPVFTGSVGARVIFLDPTALILADAGGLAISVSTQTMVELSTVPTSPITASSVYVSMWQSDCVALKCERFINFRMAKPDAVVFTNQQYV